MPSFSHRDYFCRYRLNVEQYGEILVAEAFGGNKEGDAQHGYDITIDIQKFQDRLKTFGTDARKMSVGDKNKIRIEVKSKLSRTIGGKASVVHCSDHKLDGSLSKKGVQRPGMTHLLVAIVNPGSRAGGDEPAHKEGTIENAWLLSANKARQMRKKEGTTQCIYLTQLRNETRSNEFFDIAPLLNNAANRQIRDI